MLKLRRTKSVDVDMRIFVADVMQKIQVPLQRQFWMVSALHENLNTAHLGKFVQLLIDLFERENVMIRIPFSAIKCAELAIDVANVGVIDVAIDDVGHNFATASVIA